VTVLIVIFVLSFVRVVKQRMLKKAAVMAEVKYSQGIIQDILLTMDVK